MTAILKTWPSFMPPKKVLEVFTHDWGNFYFTLGRGRPQREDVTEIYHTHRGRILGHFRIQTIVRNLGSHGGVPLLTEWTQRRPIQNPQAVAIDTLDGLRVSNLTFQNQMALAVRAGAVALFIRRFLGWHSSMVTKKGRRQG